MPLCWIVGRYQAFLVAILRAGLSAGLSLRIFLSFTLFLASLFALNEAPCIYGRRGPASGYFCAIAITLVITEVPINLSDYSLATAVSKLLLVNLQTGFDSPCQNFAI